MRRLIETVCERVVVGIAIVTGAVASATADTHIVVTTQAGGGTNWKDIALLVSPILTAAVGIGALVVTIRNAKAERWRAANQKEMEQLETLLRTFHTPYLIRSEANNNMAQDLRNRFNDPNYRMLTKLFDPKWLDSLSVGERTLVDEVCKNGSELKEFIEENSGGIDSRLAEHLARATAHFRVLALARDGKLGLDPKPFARYVYPRQLDLAIEVDRNRILRRLALLRSDPSLDHDIMPALELPEAARLDTWPKPTRPDQQSA